MAYSYVQYAGNSATTNFSVTFPFVSRDHVTVKKDGVTQAFTWLSDASIQISPAPATGTVIEIRRKTSQATKLVDFQDASILTEANLDLAATQAFYMAQEAYDVAEGTIPLGTSGVFDAQNKRITNVATPTAASDAVTKAYADSTIPASVTAAATSATAAATSATAAAASATAAATSATNAATSATSAATSAAAAAASASGFLASPSFTGDPRAPTPATSDDDTSIATTAYVKAQLVNTVLTGNPIGPTASENDNDTSLATTAFVNANMSGTYRCVGNTSISNSVTPNTQFDLTAIAVVLKNSNNHVVTRFNPSTVTCDTSVAGPIVNGRDQSGAFSANTWLHFYWIWNGTTLASVVSSSPPPTGPTLPSGFTHWAYCAALRYDGSSHLVPVRCEGTWMHYFAHIAVVNGSSPAKDVEDTIDVSAVVPPNALSLSVDGAFNAVNSSAGSTIQYALRIVSGNDIVTFSSIVSVAATYGNVGIIKIVPNRLQTLYYAWTSFGGVTSAPYSILFVNSYKVPNGGE